MGLLFGDALQRADLLAINRFATFTTIWQRLVAANRETDRQAQQITVRPRSMHISQFDPSVYHHDILIRQVALQPAQQIIPRAALTGILQGLTSKSQRTGQALTANLTHFANDTPVHRQQRLVNLTELRTRTVLQRPTYFRSNDPCAVLHSEG